MKKIQLLVIALLALATSGISQVKKGVQTVVIQTPTAQCEVCKERIERILLREPGVQKSVVDFKKHTTKVTFVSERTNIENIKTTIANGGFDADDITANEESYKKLPACCKKTEDGGGAKSQ